MTDIDSFLSFFPEVAPPITLTDESIDHISANNDALPFPLIDLFLLKWEGVEIDEFTEYVPCFKFPKIGNITCLVYWKAALLRYDFNMVTIDEKGNLIALKPLCGTIVEDDIIKKSVASIDEDFIIHIVAGAHKTNNSDYDGSYSQSFSMEVMANGEIVFMTED
jgi:hypothetical protein